MTHDGTGEISLAYIYNEFVGFNWHKSMRMLDHTNIHCTVEVFCPGSGAIPDARNEAVEIWLKECDNDWLLWTDTDVGLGSDYPNLLLATAKEHDAQIVSGLYYGRRSATHDGLGGFRQVMGPCAFTWDDDIPGWAPVDTKDFTMGEVVPINAAGFGCLLVHRSVYKEMGDTGWHNPVVSTTHAGRHMSEDLSFFLRVKAMDRFKTVMQSRARCNHIKNVWLA